jgi:hypothetical protein
MEIARILLLHKQSQQHWIIPENYPGLGKIMTQVIIQARLQ